MTGVLVLGATGRTGGMVAARLAERHVDVRAASRTPSAAQVRFDWDDPTTFAPALTGVDRVYLVPPVLSVDTRRRVEPFLELAGRSGVRRLVLLGSAIDIPDGGGAEHLAERVRSRPGWVVLKPSAFQQNYLPPHPLGRRIRDERRIRTSAPHGRVGWIDAADIAAVAAVLLEDPGLGDRPEYVLTGPESFSYTDAARVLGARLGDPIEVQAITPAQVAADHRTAGLPAPFADALATTERAIEAGTADQVTPTVHDLTGRPPRPFTTFTETNHDAWLG